ncbi:MAG: T9SS type A sorting domain-containing protein [Sphingobacteriales bacterium]|nr:MAG: T9SS type A sorting domain-containing protein [Sphingobacteriales bacterium]
MDSQRNRTIFAITNSEEEQLLEIAGSGTKTSYKAQAILYAARGTDFPVVLPALASGGDNWYSSFKGGQDRISALYPNPTQNNVSFSHHLQTGETGTLQIFSLMGKEMGNYVFIGESSQNVDISNFQTGLYFCVFSVNGTVFRNSKLSVIK